MEYGIMCQRVFIEMILNRNSKVMMLLNSMVKGGDGEKQ